MEKKEENFSRTAIHFTPMSESELNVNREHREKMEAYAREALRPTAEAMAEEHRVTGLMYDAVMKGDRAEFNRLFEEHMIPRARQREAEEKEAAAAK